MRTTTASGAMGMAFGTQTYVFSLDRHSDSLQSTQLTPSQKGIIIKWVILASFTFLFFAWFVGGYIHAKRRLKKGLPLLSYHRVSVPPHPLITILANASAFTVPNAVILPPPERTPEPLHFLQPNPEPILSPTKLSTKTRRCIC